MRKHGHVDTAVVSLVAFTVRFKLLYGGDGGGGDNGVDGQGGGDGGEDVKRGGDHSIY